VGALAALVAGALGRMFVAEGIKWLAFKALMVLLFMVVLPIVLKNVFYDILKIYLDWVTAKVAAVGTGSLSGQVVQVTGMGGWLAAQLKIPDCCAVLVSALSLRVTLKLTFAFWGPKF
jgi:hypothetical protein